MIEIENEDKDDDLSRCDDRAFSRRPRIAGPCGVIGTTYIHGSDRRCDVVTTGAMGISEIFGSLMISGRALEV
jgi:hypothetical protein